MNIEHLSRSERRLILSRVNSVHGTDIHTGSVSFCLPHCTQMMPPTLILIHRPAVLPRCYKPGRYNLLTSLSFPGGTVRGAGGEFWPACASAGTPVRPDLPMRWSRDVGGDISISVAAAKTPGSSTTPITRIPRSGCSTPT
jgi:hypothetical protein